MLEKVKDFLKYDPETGMFLRLKSKHPRYVGYWFKGNPTSRGYLEVMFCGVKYTAHQLAWFITNGEVLTYLDHINGDVTDNRISNLRVSDPSKNQKNRKFNKNNTSGESGITISSSGKFRVRVRLDKKLVDLGSYSSLDEAKFIRDLFYTENNFDPQHGVRGKDAIQSQR